MNTINSTGARNALFQAGFAVTFATLAHKYTRLSSALTSFPMRWQMRAFAVSTIVQSYLLQAEERGKVFSKQENVLKNLSPFIFLAAAAYYVKATRNAILISSGILGCGQVIISNIVRKNVVPNYDCFSVVNEHFTSYDQEAVNDSLKEKKAPTPIYSSPINIPLILKANFFDAALYGTLSLFTIYVISSICIRIFSKNTNFEYQQNPRIFQVISVLSLFFLYRITQVIVGCFIHPTTTPFLKADDLEMFRVIFDRQYEYQAMRISAITSTRHQIDGVLLKNRDVDIKGRWVLITPPNAQFYERMMYTSSGIVALGSSMKANMLFFNYPGAGASSGLFPNRDAIVASHQAMLAFLKEIGATEIIDFGWSIGGGVKWKDYSENPPTKENYCSIDYNTFRSISNFGREIFGELGGQAIKFLQWEYNSEKTIQTAKHPYIVLQSSDRKGNICHDGVVTKENALGEVSNKEYVILSTNGHCDAIGSYLKSEINKRLRVIFNREF